MFLRVLCLGLLAVGTVNAAPASAGSVQSADQPLAQSSKFDLTAWLRNQVYQEERDLVIKSALHSWLAKNPAAAQQAQAELEEFNKSQEAVNRAISDRLQVNATEELEKSIKMEELELATRRDLLSKLSSMNENQIKQVIAQYQDEFDRFVDQQADSKFTTAQAATGDMTSTLKSMLEQSLANEEAGLEIYRRAYEYALANPDAAAEAEQLRQAVMQQMLADGEISQRAATRGEEMGVVSALNQTVYMKEKIVRGLTLALQILENQPSAVPATTYQIQQTLQDPEFVTQEMSNDETQFDTVQFGGAYDMQTLSPLLARQAMRSAVPFGEFADSDAQASRFSSSPFIALM